MWFSSSQQKINSGVKRLNKELKTYQKEADGNKAKVDKLKSESSEPTLIKKQEEVLQETLAMIPDTRKRLEIAFNELKGLMGAAMGDPTIVESNDFKEANTLLGEVQVLFSS